MHTDALHFYATDSNVLVRWLLLTKLRTSLRVSSAIVRFQTMDAACLYSKASIRSARKGARFERSMWSRASGLPQHGTLCKDCIAALHPAVTCATVIIFKKDVHWGSKRLTRVNLAALQPELLNMSTNHCPVTSVS